MKSKYLYGGLLCILLAAVSLFAFKGNEKPDFVEYEVTETTEDFFAPRSEPSIFKFTRDSISNAANDTTLIPGILASNFSYRIGIQLANGTGTRALKIYLEDCNGLQGSNAGIYATGWTIRDSITAATTRDEYSFVGANVFGLRHRLRVDGTAAATQKTYFRINATYKPY